MTDSQTYVPIASEDLQENFRDLVKLFSRTCSAHILSGDVERFNIESKWKYNVRPLVLFSFFCLFALMSAVAVVIYIVYISTWSVFLVLLLIPLFMPFSYLITRKHNADVHKSITTDTIQRKIFLYSNDLLGRRWNRKVELSFDDIRSIKTEAISGWQKIIIKTDRESYHLLSLPKSINDLGGQKVFMARFKRIVKLNE